MYEDIIRDVDWDEDDAFEQFLKGVLEHLDDFEKDMRDIKNDINDIKYEIDRELV